MVLDVGPKRRGFEEGMRRIEDTVENYRKALWSSGVRVANSTALNMAKKIITDMGHSEGDAEKWLKRAESSPPPKGRKP